jgi:hypothetical protein|tara:strand:- start:31 stop:333 length:303 start_codon:yes stop_codon:yes gene_type:complete
MNNISNEFENKKNQYDSSEKFISSSDQDNLIKDLKDSFMESIYSTDEIFKNLITAIKETINDEEIRNESTQNIDNTFREFKNSLGEIQNKLSLNLIFEEE